jgi:hypothetical protein
MTIDHIGVYLIRSPEGYTACRIIGRLAMPLFCFLVAEGYRHSSNRKQYFYRLFGFAIVVEFSFALYYLLTGLNYLIRFNVFLTLSAGLACLILLKSKKPFSLPFTLLIFVLVFFSNIQYGLYGVLLILLFGLTENFLLATIGFTLLNAIFIALFPLLQLERGMLQATQWFSLLSLIPIFYYNGQLGKDSKTFFYLYYPAHILVLLAIKSLL